MPRICLPFNSSIECLVKRPTDVLTPNLPKSALMIYEGFGVSGAISIDKMRPTRISSLSKVFYFGHDWFYFFAHNLLYPISAMAYKLPKQ